MKKGKEKKNSELNKGAIILLSIFCVAIGVLFGWLWGYGIICLGC